MVALTNINSEPTLTQYLVKNKMITLDVVDVGARDGFAEYWGYYKDALRIVGFDPDKKEAEKLGGQGIAHALSGDGKPRVFYMIRYPASSGFYPPNIDFTNRLRNRDFLNIMNTAEIDTVTMDSLDLRPDFIKLDAEGSELEILQGGMQTIKHALGIRVEVAFVELFKDQPLFREVDAFLASQGFTLYDLTTFRLERLLPNQVGMSHGDTGQVIVGQALYFRDIYKDLDKYDEQTILKLASLFEVFNLTDCAFEILNSPKTEKYLGFIGE